MARGIPAQIAKLRDEGKKILNSVADTDAAVLMHLRAHQAMDEKLARRIKRRRKALAILLKRCQDRLAAIATEYRQLAQRVARLESPRRKSTDRRRGA